MSSSAATTTTTTTTTEEHDVAKRKHSDGDETPSKRARHITKRDACADGSDHNNSSPRDPRTESRSKDQLLADMLAQIRCPRFGQIVNRRDFRRAGPYLIGQKLGQSPVDSIVQYLAKKENSNEFVQLKILMLSTNSRDEKLLQDELQGKMLLHTEFSLLSLLQNQPGVIQQHGLFSDMAYEEEQLDSHNNSSYYTGKVRKRLILVLDCVTAHEYDDTSSAYVNLQQYMINRKKLPEIEALKIFYEILLVIENLHNNNVIHRDLKLGNIVLNVHSNKIKIINFCLGKYLMNENHLLNDQRGSPAYISPDVLCGKPYKGKPSDMWALGVVLFMMLYRQFPFFETTPTALFKKIKSADYMLPMNAEVSDGSERIIKGLLQLDAEKRLTATQVRERVEALLKRNVNQSSDRTVPSYHEEEIPSSPGHDITVDQAPVRDTSKSHIGKRIWHQQDQTVPVVPDSVLATMRSHNLSSNTMHQVPAGNRLANTQPTRLHVERVSQDARHVNLTDIGQLLRPIQMASLNLHNLARTWQDVMRIRNGSHTATNNSSQVTQQMSNLTLRSRRDQHRRITNGDTSRAAPNNTSDIINVSSNLVAPPPTDLSRYISRFYRNRNHPTPRHAITDRAIAEAAARVENRDLQSLFKSFTEMFVRNRGSPMPTNLQEFTGIITDDLANKWCEWLVREHRRHSLIQSIFVQSTCSIGDKVLQFLRQCGVQMQTTNQVTKIRRHQSLNLIVVLSHLLQSAGYSNSYFL